MAKCPKDGSLLSESPEAGLKAMRCPSCAGCWLAEEGVRQAFARLPKADARRDKFRELMERDGRDSAHACGACGGVLRTVTHRGVEIDGCLACGGIWFDGDELRRFLGARPVSSSAVAAGVVGAAALGAAGVAMAAGEQDDPNKDSGSSLGDVVDAADLAGDAISLIFNLFD
jgi:Zn-finger nucleic acid-binding protein